MPLNWPLAEDSRHWEIAAISTPGGVIHIFFGPTAWDAAGEHSRSMASGPIVGVLSGCGGAGASVLAAAIAGCASRGSGARSARTGQPAFLIDCDSMGGGIDVLLGAEQTPGPRWRQVRLRGGRLDPAVLLDSLPRWGRVSFLAADTSADLDPEAVTQILDAAALAGPVIADLPRWSSAVRSAAIDRCDRTVLVTPAEVRAVTASALVAASLDPQRSTVAVRGVCRSLPADRIGQLLGLPVLGEIPWEPASQRSSGLDVGKLRRGTRLLAQAALDVGISAEAAA
jgi:secretion/DNA translocation related CpaE-like protein